MINPASARRAAWNPVRTGSAPAMGAAAKAASATGGVTVEITAKKTTKRCKVSGAIPTASMPELSAMTMMK